MSSRARTADRGERRTRVDYFDAGMELLAIGGVQSVTIANLCARLRVTKGSFYHHFESGDQYKTELLTHWAGARTQQVEDAASQVSDPLERLEMLKRFAVDLPHEAESAIRAWSRNDQSASRMRALVDAARERIVAEAYRDAGASDSLATLLGHVLVAVLIGAQQRDDRTNREQLLAMFDWTHAAALDRIASARATRKAVAAPERRVRR